MSSMTHLQHGQRELHHSAKLRDLHHRIPGETHARQLLHEALVSSQTQHAVLHTLQRARQRRRCVSVARRVQTATLLVLMLMLLLVLLQCRDSVGELLPRLLRTAENWRGRREDSPAPEPIHIVRKLRHARKVRSCATATPASEIANYSMTYNCRGREPPRGGEERAPRQRNRHFAAK